MSGGDTPPFDNHIAVAPPCAYNASVFVRSEVGVFCVLGRGGQGPQDSPSQGGCKTTPFFTVEGRGDMTPHDASSGKDLDVAMAPMRDTDLRLDLDDALQTLTGKQRTVIALWSQGYSQEEIGRCLGVSHQAVARTWKRAVTKLRKLVP